MSDFIAQLFLNCIDPIVILLLIAIFALKIDRFISVQILCLLCFTIVVNFALKVTFKIPVSISVHKIAYAFPSGHMDLATTFYLWLAQYIRSWKYRGLIMIILIGIGAGLVQFHYHTIEDVVGGFLCGCLIVTLYYLSLKQFHKNFPWLLLVTASPLMLYIHHEAQAVSSYPIPLFYYLLVAIVLVEKTFSKNGSRFNSWLSP